MSNQLYTNWKILCAALDELIQAYHTSTSETEKNILLSSIEKMKISYDSSLKKLIQNNAYRNLQI